MFTGDRAVPRRADRKRPTLPVVPCRGGEFVPRRLFELLGYVVEASAIPLDMEFPSWGGQP